MVCSGLEQDGRRRQIFWAMVAPALEMIFVRNVVAKIWMLV